MPKYAKFLKEILSNKRKLEEYETINLNEECSAILLKKLPPKLKDPGNFTIPCTIGNTHFKKALCDLGASINLMPLSVFRRLGMQEPKPTSVSLQLADRSITYPRGIIEDVLIKVDKFIFPADFIVLDMEEDEEIPLILGRPFLATAGALIDVKMGKLTLRLEDEEVTFQVFNSAKHQTAVESCNMVGSVMVNSSSHGKLHNRAVGKKNLKKGQGNQALPRKIQKGDKVLIHKARFRLLSREPKPKWCGPYSVKAVHPYGILEVYKDGEKPFTVIEQWAKLYCEGDIAANHVIYPG